MTYILLPALVTLISIICESCIRKQKHHPIFYVRVFAILLGLELLLTSSYVKSEELEAINGSQFETGEIKHIDPWLTPDISEELMFLNEFPVEMLTTSQRSQYEKKEKEHRIEGKKHFNAANEICVLIPNITDREKAKELFIAAVSASTQGRSWSAIVTGLSALLIQYCINVYDQWNQMKTHLNWSKYHFEMMEFYQDLLKTS